MQYLVGLENGDDNRSVAWVLGHPGCFAYGAGPQEALQAAGPAIATYAAWVASLTPQPWLDAKEIELSLVESWDVYGINESFEKVPLDTPGSYSVNAWFNHDWKPLSPEDVERALLLLDASRADLLATLSGLSPHVLEMRFSGERWSIARVAQHVGNSEWYYLDRLGLASPSSAAPEELPLPEELLPMLEMVRLRLKEVLPSLVGSTQVVGVDGEFWSPRKLLRRAVWHERDHTRHIEKLIERSLEQGSL